MQDALSACHSRLDIANLGMDDSALAASAKAALDPQAQSLTAPLQGPNAAQHSRLLGQSVHSIAAVEAALGQLAGFLDALERLLTMSFPVAVPVPAHGILMLLTRILSFDDSARQAGKVCGLLHNFQLNAYQLGHWAKSYIQVSAVQLKDLCSARLW